MDQSSDERRRSLRSRSDHMRTKNHGQNPYNIDFYRLWYNGAEVKMKCLGCKVVSKSYTKWEDNHACVACPGPRAKPKRPCFRLYDRRTDNGQLVREVHVLPFKGSGGVNAF